MDAYLREIKVIPDFLVAISSLVSYLTQYMHNCGTWKGV